MRVLVLGGDGFCGWPTSLYLSDRGHEVTIVNNLSRRKIDIDLEVDSLTPIRPIGERIRVWEEVSGREIGFVSLDLATEYDRLAGLLAELRPDAIVHFAEQRAAPYSMRTTATKRYTVDNNVRATHNLLTALVETGINAALAHLGTMGVYGYGWSGSAPIPEGYLRVKVPTPDGELEREILHPANPGSVYHMTKTLDQLMFAFYAKNDGLRITDLHQGIVWGTQTDQTRRDERLINRFDYDGDYGTVLNRFLMQAAIGHPLTVHGTGGQARAFIHIRDTVRCIELAITNPPQAGERPRVLNQITETHRVLDLAKMVADVMGVDIAYLPNPRREAEENELIVRNDQFLALGLQPTTLSEGLLGEGIEVARHYAHRADPSKIIARSVWKAGMETADDLMGVLSYESVTALATSSQDDAELLRERITRVGRGIDQQNKKPDAQIPIRLYMSDSQDHERVEAALRDLIDEFGFKIDRESPPSFGSYWRELRARPRRSGTDPSTVHQTMAELDRMIRWHIDHDRQLTGFETEAKAIAELVSSLEATREAVIQVGSVLLIKADNIIIVRHLSPEQIASYEDNPHCFRDAHARSAPTRTPK